MNQRSSKTPEPAGRSTCPTCGKRFLMDETSAPPFCGERCRMVDLGRWLDEGISLPQDQDGSPKTIDRELVDDLPEEDR